MNTPEKFAQMRRPTAARPLLGLTILVVEDSRFACDAMRLMCLRSGARIRRADCLKSARRHLGVYRPTVAIIDLGLPDGSGADLIAELASASPRISTILGTSGDSFARDMAIASGADGFLDKPLDSVAAFQSAIIDHLPSELRPIGPRLMQDEPISPDPMAYRDDMAHIADILCDGSDNATIDYVAQFLTGVGRSAGDGALVSAAEALSLSRSEGQPLHSPLARVAGLVQQRLSDRIAL